VTRAIHGSIFAQKETAGGKSVFDGNEGPGNLLQIIGREPAILIQKAYERGISGDNALVGSRRKSDISGILDDEQFFEERSCDLQG